jgi:hypothetical protein
MDLMRFFWNAAIDFNPDAVAMDVRVWIRSSILSQLRRSFNLSAVFAQIGRN